MMNSNSMPEQIAWIIQAVLKMKKVEIGSSQKAYHDGNDA